MGCDYGQEGLAWIPWTSQRIANRFPRWSRARQRLDSNLRATILPFAEEYDELYTQLFMVRDNYFVSTTDLQQPAFAYVLRLPMEFAFELSTEETRTWYLPDVIATLNGQEIEVQAIDEWIEASPYVGMPDRLTATLKASSISNTLLASTALNDMGSSLFDNTQLLRLPSKLWIEIDGATAFGGETTDGSVLDPKVVINGQPVQYDYLDEIFEHLSFPTNDQLRSKDTYDSVWSIETRGINNPEDTTIEVTRGFNKDSVIDPYALWVDADRERRFSHKLQRTNIKGYPLLSSIQFVVPEYPVAFQTQGFDEEEVVFENLLVGGDVPDDGYVAIERIPFTPNLVAISQNTLDFLPSSPSFAFGDLTETRLQVLQKLYNARTPNPNLVLEVDRNWMNISQEGSTGIDLLTHRKGQQTILSTRLTRYTVLQDGTLDKDVLDWDGGVINISLDPNQGFIMNPDTNGAPDGWREKCLSVNPLGELLANRVPVYIFQLETKLAGGEIQTDSALVYVPTISPLETVPLPSELRNKIAGLKYEDGCLLVLTTEQQVYELNLHYDLALVDFRNNTLYLVEEYDQVQVLTEGDAPDEDEDEGNPNAWCSPDSEGSHEFQITISFPAHAGENINIVAFYGGVYGGDPDGVCTVSSPGTHSIYVPNSGPETEVSLLVSVDVNEDGDFDDPEDYIVFIGSSLSITGPGPTTQSVLIS